MELLAPAGTYGCVRAAVNSGADAVYFAGKGFGARSFAGNLSDEEIFRAADFCHLRNVRTYVTVNTLVFDREYKELEKFIKTVTRAGVDGVIIQDLGVLKVVREISPDVELHASTQMTVHSADGVKELEKLGVSRVVLARELSCDEMSDIIQNTSAEAEVFVHGAMCMSYSGQCLMSSVIGGRSGNRGKCAQPCRLPYSSGGDARFYLSLKDMSLAEHIEKLKKIGVASLKIEGRMKGEAYVSSVVEIYRRLIDEGRKPTKNEVERLNRIFFRGGLTDGYFMGNKGKNMFAFDKPDNPYLKNDGEEHVLDDKQIPASIYAEFSEGESPAVRISSGKHSAKIKGEFVLEAASNRPATEESIKTQLLKTGGTAFKITDAEIKLKGSLFIPVSRINELRRCAVEKLENEILKEYRDKRISEQRRLENPISERKEQKYTCLAMTAEQYRAIRGYDFARIYMPLHIVYAFSDELRVDADRIVLSLPVILRGGQREKASAMLDELKKKGFNKAEISTIDALPLVKGFEVFGSQRMNITNTLSAKEIEKAGVSGMCLSPELNMAQMRDVGRNFASEVIAYGRIPLMITENCILKNADKCPCDGNGEITDRTGARFPVVRDGEICRSVVLNSVPLYMGDKLDDLNKINSDLRLMFTVETPERCREICKNYFFKEKQKIEDFTRLNFYKSSLE